MKSCCRNIVFVFVAAVSSMSLAKEPVDPCVHSELLQLPLLEDHGHATVNGDLSGRAIQLMVDTGAQTTLLLRENLPPGVGIQVGRSPAVFGVGGKAYATNLRVQYLKIGPLEAGNTFVAMDGFNWMKTAAILGSDFLFRNDLELDYPARMLRVHKQSGCNGDYLFPAEAHAYRLDQMVPADPRAIVEIEINGAPVRALVDSAATRTVIFLPFAQSIGIDPSNTQPTINARGAGDQIRKMWTAEFHTLRIGKESWNHPSLAILPTGGHPPYQVILGQDFLAIRHLLFTRQPRAVFITPSADGSLFRTTAAMDPPPP